MADEEPERSKASPVVGMGKSDFFGYPRLDVRRMLELGTLVDCGPEPQRTIWPLTIVLAVLVLVAFVAIVIK